MIDLLDRVGISRARCRSLHRFLLECWHVLEPGVPLVDGWHLDEVAAHLEALFERRMLRLVLSQPPATTKSRLACVAFPAWIWGPRGCPWEKILLASYAQSLASDHVREVSKLLSSQWFRERWGDLHESSTPSVLDLRTKAGGRYMATMPGGAVTGFHAGIKIVDDPIKAAEAQGAAGTDRTAIRFVIQWHSGSWSTRNVSHATTAELFMMQRLADGDPSSVLLEKGWPELRLPMRAVASRLSRTPIGGDRRSRDRELLCPERFPERLANELEGDDPDVWAAQFQQDPTRADGARFRREWFRYYDALPPGLGNWIQAWDMNFKGQAGADPVSGGLWAVLRERAVDAERPEVRWRDSYYLVDRFNARVDLPEVLDQIRAWFGGAHPTDEAIVEGAANGHAVEQLLRREFGDRIVVVTTLGGAPSRAAASAKIFRRGDVYLPRKAPWIAEFEEQFLRYPRAKFDDDVDMTSHALARLSSGARRGFSLRGLAAGMR